MNRSLFRLLCAAVALASLTGTLAFAQTGAPASLGGVVTDKDGGVMPGVTVVAKNNATGVSLAPVVTNNTGVFSIPSLDPGTYTVTASLSGFKTVVVGDVKVITATPTNLKVTLDVGQLSETVNVTANTEVVQTQATTVASTINALQIANLPLVTRNALNFVTFLPGVDTGNQHSQRASTVAGLPNSALAISIDGVNTQDNLLKSSNTSGFFSIIQPSVDAIEEVTVSTAAPGAASSAQGAVQINFVTKSGTNTYTGSAYEYYRDPVLNSNNYFGKLNGLAKNKITVNQFGMREGGPIRLPGYDGHGKAFFFVNYEEFRQPSEITRTRTVMNAAARNGILSYTSGGVTQNINVLAVAAANGQISTVDPVVSGLLAKIAAATATTGTVAANTDPNTSSYTFQSPSNQTRHFPTIRLDLNLSPKNRLSGTYNFQKFNSNPDPLNNDDAQFPGFLQHGAQYSYRNSTAVSLRSTLSANIVNEVRFGDLWAPVYFFGDTTPAMFADQGGFGLTLAGGGGGGAFNGLSRAYGQRGPESRNGADWNLDDTLSWQHGNHSFQFGENFTQISLWQNDYVVVPNVTLGVDTTFDPAAGMFTTGNFPGASAQNLSDAQYLYALLTGRVNAINGEVDLGETTGQYKWLGVQTQRARMNEAGFFAQDAWRVKPNLTFNLGLRYELQFPFKPLNGIYAQNSVADLCGVSGLGNGIGGRPCNIFTPGTLTGTTPVYEPYTAGSPGYKTSYNNFAPSLGAAWQPNVQHGILRAILGDPQQATIRAAFGVAYNREGLNTYTGVYSSNPGASIAFSRNVSNGNLVLPGESWPILLSQTNRLGAPTACTGSVTPSCFALTPSYPESIDRGSGVNLFDPNYQVAHTNSYTIGLQRAVSKDMAIEVRYVGTRNRNGTVTQNWNEANIVENGFLNEFKLAQANLYANIAAGRGSTFAYQGAGSGTSPLPTFLAYFNGVNGSQSGDPTKYTGSSWTSPTFAGFLAQLNPQPYSFATNSTNGLYSTAASRGRALAAGLPANFFVMNPDVNGANITLSQGNTRYDSLQVDVRRRLSSGLAIDANFTHAVRYSDTLDSLRRSRVMVKSTDGVPNALKLTVNYDIPVGRGKRFGTDMNPWLDGFVGGWSLNLTGRAQSGQVLDFGNVRVVGMTLDDLQNAVSYRVDSSTTPAKLYNLPQDIIDNTVKAFSFNVGGYTKGAPTGRYLAPANGPDCIQVVRGDCAPRDVFVVAPVFSRFDLSAKKRIQTGGKTNFTLEVDVLNVFNAIDFNPTSPGNNNSIGAFNFSNSDTYRVTSAYSDVNGTFDPGGRVGQLVFRFNF